MATLDDKLLGEKTQNYCSSSEDEGMDEEDNIKTGQEAVNSCLPEAQCPSKPWQGYSQNTGPKGVLKDWKLFQEHEEHSRVERAKTLQQLCTDRSLTCRTEAEDDKAKEAEIDPLDEDDLLSDEVLRDFVKKRMEEMLKAQNEITYGVLEEILTADDYLKILDDTSPKVTVVMHIYDQAVRECVRLNECLTALSAEYRYIRFCKIRATVVGVTAFFKQEGVPALLVYKNGNLIANFVKMKEVFGSEFYPGDVENFLIENGVLHDQSNISSLLIEKCKVK